MSTTTELAELNELSGRLQHTVMSLRARYGESPAMRRIVLDAERILGDLKLLELDAHELGLSQHTSRPVGEKIAIPDTGYERDFWAGVDDEGVGGQR